ncbi:MAG: amino acid-binding protein [Campylobacterales bacterium]|nr:amino acid-binding protein [Campylobacterales bacterium]
MESYKLEQLTVFVENRSGELLAITSLLEDEGISLTSIMLSDSSEFGLLRLLTPEVARAKATLLAQGFMAQSSYVLGVKIDNHIGSFNRIVRILASVNVDIRYTYTVNEKEFGIFIFKLDDEVFHTAMTALLREEVALLRLEDL